MRPAVRDLVLVIGVSWVARAIFVAAIGDAHSLDVEYWRGALSAQDEGKNPYETGVLNWPPLWLMVIVAVDAVSNAVGLGFWNALRIYLVAVETALVVVLYFTLVSFGAGRRAVRRALLVGVALNPIAIILVCQHGNSDVQVGLFVTLAIAALGMYWRSRDALLWLCGCLFLGLGVLAKTTPLVLAPLLAPGARLATWVGRGLGATLFLGPAALGVGVIFVLTPRAVWDHVIGYRSTRGFFGLSGMVTEFSVYDVPLVLSTAAAIAALVAIGWLLRRLSPESFRPTTESILLVLLGLVVLVLWIAEVIDDLTSIDVGERYGTVFTSAVLALFVWLCRHYWRQAPSSPETLLLLVATVFMTVVAFGPGYGSQYAYWFMPALIGTYVLLDDGWRRLLLVAYAIAAVTYSFEYGVVPFLGAWAAAIFGMDDWIVESAEFLTPAPWVLFRLPLFAMYLVLIAAGIDRLARRSEPARAYDAKL